ncbi:MAG: sulfatase [Solirubrobacterales bacterium]|nr:sulfatase [Solirubrobacterales bacterium]
MLATALRRLARAPVVAGTVFALICGVAYIGATSGPAKEAVRPNILVIITDDQTVESMRVMDEVRSRIGGPGATFAQSYVNFPLCCPSRATLLIGQYAHNHRVLDNEPPLGGYGRFAALHGHSNLATWLEDSGYRTALIGKYFNGYGDVHPAFVPSGWTDWYGAVSPAQHVYDYDLNENGHLVHYGTSRRDFKEDVLTSKATDLIARNAPSADPFFLEIAYTAPHAAGPNPSPQPPNDCPASPKAPARFAHAFDREPLPRPPAFNEADVSDKPAGVRDRPLIGPQGIRRLTRRYRCTLEAVRGVDDDVGKLLDALTESGEADNTLVVFTSDNGLFFGEHRIPGGKVRHYEEATRVPLLISGPGIEPGTTIDEPVINADLAPTLLDAANAAAGAPIDGLSLLPLGSGEETDLGRDLLLESGHYAAIRTDRYVYVEHGPAMGQGARELYDLEADPDELHNLAESPRRAELIGDLSRRLGILRECAGSSCSEDLAPASR